MTNDLQTCQASSDYISKNTGMWMWNCLIIQTTNNKPVGLENIEPLPYKFASELESYQGQVMLGAS
jgi:hypothetical protein